MMTLTTSTRSASFSATAAARLDLVQVSSDPLRDYLQQIGRTQLLTADEEVDLAKRIEAGVFAGERLALHSEQLDGTARRELAWLVNDGERAFDSFICANLRLVVSIAKRYAGRGLPMMDVIQEGNLGLVRAVEKFDYTSGNKFSTYATWWIRQSVLRGIADSSRIIRIPVHTVERMDKLDRIRRDLGAELGRTPTVIEVADAAQISVDEVMKLEKINRDTISLGLPVGDDGNTELGDLIEDADIPEPFEAVHQGLQNDDIRRRLDALPQRDATVIRLRFGLEGRPAMTLDEVGEIYGITRERVRQLETRGLKRMRCDDLRGYLA